MAGSLRVATSEVLPRADTETTEKDTGVIDVSRQQQELHDREKWDLEKMVDRFLEKMETDVDKGNALQRILKAERLAAQRDTNEQERTDVTHCER